MTKRLPHGWSTSPAREASPTSVSERQAGLLVGEQGTEGGLEAGDGEQGGVGLPGDQHRDGHPRYAGQFGDDGVAPVADGIPEPPGEVLGVGGGDVPVQLRLWPLAVDDVVDRCLLGLAAALGHSECVFRGGHAHPSLEAYWRATRALEPAAWAVAVRATAKIMLLLMSDPVAIVDALEVVFDFLGRTDSLAPQSVAKSTLLLRRFERFLVHGLGLSSLDEVDQDAVRQFVESPGRRGFPAPATKHARRAAVRVAFRVLIDFQIADHDPSGGMEIGPRTPRDIRALTDHELEACRWASLATLVETRQPALVALAETGAVTSEIAEVRVGDVDLATGRVRLPGCKTARSREVVLSDWGRQQVRRRCDGLGDPTVPLVYEGSGSAEARQASIATALGRILERAQVTGCDVTCTSFRVTAGRRVFDATGDIRAVAVHLGCQSLDTAASIIGWEWATA